VTPPGTPIDCEERDGDLVLAVHVRPRASRSKIEGVHDGALALRLAAPPVEGAANKELCRVLAKAFGVARGAVSIESGARGRRKRVRIAGVGRVALDDLLGEH